MFSCLNASSPPSNNSTESATTRKRSRRMNSITLLTIKTKPMGWFCSWVLSLRLTHLIQEQRSARHNPIAASQTVANYEEAIHLAVYMYLAPAKPARLLLEKYN